MLCPCWHDSTLANFAMREVRGYCRSVEKARTGDMRGVRFVQLSAASASLVGQNRKKLLIFFWAPERVSTLCSLWVASDKLLLKQIRCEELHLYLGMLDYARLMCNQAMQQHRLLVAPLRYGAGVKGKAVTSLLGLLGFFWHIA